MEKEKSVCVFQSQSSLCNVDVICWNVNLRIDIREEILSKGA